MREITMDKNTIRETVRMIASDQSVISVVGVTVSRKEILENFIVTNNEMMTVVGGNSLPRLGKKYAADSHIFKIHREILLWKHCMG